MKRTLVVSKIWFEKSKLRLISLIFTQFLELKIILEGDYLYGKTRNKYNET